MLFELRRTRVETAIIAAFRGGARRFGPPLNTPLLTVKLLIEGGSQIEARSLIRAGYPIEAGCHLMALLKTYCRHCAIVLFRGNKKYR